MACPKCGSNYRKRASNNPEGLCNKCYCNGTRYQRTGGDRVIYNRRMVLRKYWRDCTPEELIPNYERLLAHQGGVCAVCKRPPEGQNLAVDHCHTTGKIRGLLCKPCNSNLVNALEHHRHNLSAALQYLDTPPYQELNPECENKVAWWLLNREDKT